jgi:hypothetical protein
MKRLSLLILIFLLSFMGCVTHEVSIQEKGATLLSQDQLKNLFSETVTINYTMPSKASQTFFPDGTTTIDIKGYKSDSGTYRLSNGQYCSTWQTIRKTEKCFKIYKIGDEYHLVNKAGSLDSKGNIGQ